MEPVSARKLVRNYMGGLFRTGRSKLKAYLCRSLPSPLEIELLPGLRVHCDLRNKRQFFIFWFFEEDESGLQWIIRNLLPVGGNYVDVGANFGLFGLLAVYHRQARALLFEPNPQLVDVIEWNIASSGFGGRAKVFPFAVSSQDGTAEFFLDEKNDGRSSLSSAIKFTRTISVQLWRSARLFEDGLVDHIDLLKIDTEGHDLAVLEGLGANLTPRKISMIYVEMEAPPKERKKQALLLAAAGYAPFEVYNFFIDALRRYQRAGEEFRMIHAVADEAKIKSSRHLNYLWVERESAAHQFLQRFARLNDRVPRAGAVP